jgi:proline dehydrogenase
VRGNPFGRAVVAMVRILPKSVVWRLARRYVAGADLAQAMAVAERLKGEGSDVTIDLLGEGRVTAQRAVATRDEYLRAVTTLHDRGLRGGVSVKLTALGLDLQNEFCAENLEAIVTHAASLGRFVRVDMEQSTYTDATLDMVMDMHSRHSNIGAVIQACLRRSDADVRRLAEAGISVRLCKGIYREGPDIALTDFHEIRRNYLQLLGVLIGAGCYPGIATHDPFLVRQAIAMVSHLGPRDYEFQMLQGVATGLRRGLLRKGHRVRVYVPYGEDWHAYSLRRLDENPRIASHMARALIGL